MKSFKLCAMQKDRKAILERLQVIGAVETKLTEAGDGFERLDSKSEYTAFLANVDKVSRALEILQQASPRKKPMLAFLEGRREVPFSVVEEAAEKAPGLLDQANGVLKLKAEIDGAKNEILLNEAQESLLMGWLDLPEPEGYPGTKRAAAFIGSLSGEHTADQIVSQLESHLDPEQAQSVYAQIVLARPEHTNFFLISLRRDAEAVEEALRQIGFSRPQATDGLTPVNRRESLRAQRKAMLQTIEENEKKLIALDSLRDDFERLQDYYSMRAEKYQVLEQLALSRHAFVLEGYVLEKDAQRLKDDLESNYTASLSIEDPDGEAPVALSNPSFSGALEGVLESYSMPGKGEFDPAVAMSVFYYFMFGLMFSDAGYGLIMAIACGFCLKKFKNMEESWRKSLTMFFWCGVSTVFWGVMFSSYFGDAINVITYTFFGKEMGIPPLWFLPMENPMKLLIFCLGIGLAHLTLGYVLNGVKKIRQGAVIDAVWDALLPITVIYPLIVILTGSDMFLGLAGFKNDIPPLVTQVCLAVSGASMVFVVLTAGRESKSWFKRLLKGVYGLYNILAGWLSDVLSYSRLLALGLATGVIASIMNQLGAMGGKSVFGVLLFIVVFAAGQALNFGINVLGAYVHSNRLEYVEFFGKFYEGGGRRFKPFGVHTKYIKIEEGKF
jgi:V/A-type H+-transporting ATPase subunit I